LIPNACHTFTRLLTHYKQLVHERSVQRFQELIHPSLRQSMLPLIQQLADSTTEAIDVAKIQIPSGSAWSLTRQLTPNDRAETLQFVRQTSIALTQSADELLVELDKLGDGVSIPEFVLGPLPEPIPEAQPTQPPVDLESEWQSQGERE